MAEEEKIKNRKNHPGLNENYAREIMELHTLDHEFRNNRIKAYHFYFKVHKKYMKNNQKLIILSKSCADESSLPEMCSSFDNHSFPIARTFSR